MHDTSGNPITSPRDELTRFLGTVQARSGGLAASESKVVKLVLADPLFVGTSSTAQVAARAGVSAPSVVRAARAIGFAGFSDLKLEIARARGTTEFFAPSAALGVASTTADVLETSIRAGIEAMTALGGAINTVALDDAVAALRRARQVLVVGAGSSVAVAFDAAFRLRALGIPVASIPDHESAVIAAHLLDAEDVVLAISSTGRTSSTLAVADAAISSGATVIGITNQYGTALALLASVALVVGGLPLPTQMAAAGSRLAQLVVIDAIAASLAIRDPDRRRRAERAGIDLPDIY